MAGRRERAGIIVTEGWKSEKTVGTSRETAEVGIKRENEGDVLITDYTCCSGVNLNRPHSAL